MVKRGSDQVGFLLVDGYNILSDVTSLEDNVEAMLQENHGFGDDWTKQIYTGVKNASISQEGFFDTDVGASHQALSGSEGVARVLCYGIEGNTPGRKFIAYNGAMQVNYNRLAVRNELTRANANYQGSGQVDEGIILHPYQLRGAPGTTTATPVDLGAPRTSGIIYIQVSDLELDGFLKADFNLLHSDDGEEWTGFLDFSHSVTTAPVAVRKSFTGELKRYVAVSWGYAVTGGENPSVKFFLGLK